MPKFESIFGLPIPDNSNILGDPIDPAESITSLFAKMSSSYPFLNTFIPLHFLLFKIILLTSHLLIILRFFLF